MKRVLLILFLHFGLTTSGQTNVHRVTRGETIYTIARLYATTPAKIADINNFDVNNVKLVIDQKLIIPNRYYEMKRANEAPKFKVYVIKPGDSYYSIARNHSLSVYDITSINKLKGNSIPKVGASILIPERENEAQQISLQELKVNIQQGDIKEREKLDEIEIEAKEYFYVKNSPYKRTKLISEHKELPIQIFYHATIKIDTGRVKKTRKSKKELADSAFLAELKEANVSQSSLDIRSESIHSSQRRDSTLAISNGQDSLLTAGVPNDSLVISTQLITNNIDDIETLTSLLEVDSLNDDFYYQRAMAHERLQNITSSLSDIDRSIAIRPENAKYYLFRANLFDRLNENKRALEDLQNAEAKGIDKQEVYMKIALIYEKEKDYKMAINFYEKEIEFNPGSGMAYYLKAIAFKQLNQYDNACNSLKKAVEYHFEMAKEEMAKIGCKE